MRKTLSTRIARAVPAGLASDERWRWANVWRKASRLHGTPRLRGLLLFTVDATLRNCPQELNEQEIGAAYRVEITDYQ